MPQDNYPGYRPKKWEEPADQIVRHKRGTPITNCHYCHQPMVGDECWLCEKEIDESWAKLGGIQMLVTGEQAAVLGIEVSSNG